jgi:hypothetical protein
VSLQIIFGSQYPERVRQLHHLPPSASSQIAQHDAALARQFFDGPAQQQPTFTLSHGLPPQILAGPDYGAGMQHMHSAAPDLRGAWPAAANMQSPAQQQQQYTGPARWAAEFEGVQAATTPTTEAGHAMGPGALRFCSVVRLRPD